MISGATRVLGVFGDPVEHSLSPRMHAEFARSTGADTVYVPFRVSPENLRTALRALPALSVLGVNLTVPHKEAATDFLDELAPAARAIGAVNTVIDRQGRLVGDNTDAEGFLADLRAQFPDRSWQGKPALVLGAGGACRAVIHALVETPIPEIAIANRSPDKAERLVEELCPDRGKPIALDSPELGAWIQQAGLIVNTTSLGLKGETVPGCDLSRARVDAGVYDLIYSPAETPLLQEARSLGLAASNGLGMLVRQGAASYRLWTGSDPAVEPVIQLLGSPPGE